MAVTSPEQYLELLERSRLLDEEQLAEARQAAPEAEDATALAKALVRKRVLTRWQAGQLLAGRATFFLGKYKLIDLLGSGGMGRVFLAEHTTISRPVALKVISKRLGRDPATVKQFFAEARAIAALDHPNMVHPYDVDSEGDRYYMVMEYVEGRDLQRMVESKGPLPFDQAARYIQQAADGLAHAHSRKMIHCDIKPANLLVNKQDVVKILDMGMARLIDRAKAPASDKDERSLGTVDYLAPEQAVESPELDHRADIYSLGCALYFLLTGKPPFPEGTLHERILKHQTDQPRSIAELRPDVPQPLAEICAKMMAKEPDARYQSADEVSRALGRWVTSHEEEAEPVLIGAEPGDGLQISTDGPATARGAGRKPSLVARAQAAFTGPRRMLWFGGLGGAVALILVAGLLFFFLGGPREDVEEKPDEQVAAGEVEQAEASEPVEQESAQPEEPGEDSEWPDLPDLGNLRDFDPEAVFNRQPGSSDATEAKEPEKSSPDKAGQAPPAPEKGPEKEAPAVEQPSPQKPEAEKPEAEKTQPEEPQPEKKEPEKKEPPKPPEKKEPPKPPTDPLKDLAESFDLPEASLRGGPGEGSAETITLGRIKSEPDVEWQLYLLGGENALRGNRAFVLEQEEADPAKARWRVQLETPKTTGEPTREDVASLWRDGDALEFQWAQKPASSANNLRNCILQVRVAGKSKYVTLCQPTSVDPILIDLERGSTNVDLPVKWLPDAANLRVQITKVEGREGHVTEPAEPADFKTPVLLSFPRTDRDGNTADRVAFRLSFTSRGGKLQLTEPKRDRFQAYKVNAQIQRNTAETALDQVNKELHPAGGEPPRGPKASQLQAQLKFIEMEMWYIDFYLNVHQKAQIHYRVYTEVDGREVVLASTQLAEQPLAADSNDPPKT